MTAVPALQPSASWAASYQSAYVHQAASGNARKTRGALVVAGLVGAAVIGLLTLALFSSVTGPVGLTVGIVAAVLPAPIYLALALRVDRYEPEPLRMLVGAFLWGATASILISAVVNDISGALVGVAAGPDAGTVFTLVVSAPFVEELSKAVVLVLIYRLRPNEFNGILDGIVYAAMVALGFATAENILYYGRAVAQDVPLGEIFLLRGIQSPFAHPLFTAMTGLGLGISIGSRSRAVKILAPLAGLAAAMFLHAVWNSSSVLEGIGVLPENVVYALFFVPVLIAMIALVAIVGRRELRLVGSHLQHDVGTGLLPASEVGVLASGPARRRALRAAAARGNAAKKARKRFHTAATELALHRHKVATGTYAGTTADHDDLAYQHEIRSLQPQFGGAAPAQPVSPSGAPAAWHPDPYGQARLRWWDGSRWSEHTAP